MGSQITIRSVVCQVASSKGTCQAETKTPERRRALRTHVPFEKLQFQYYRWVKDRGAGAGSEAEGRMQGLDSE